MVLVGMKRDGAERAQAPSLENLSLYLRKAVTWELKLEGGQKDGLGLQNQSMMQDELGMRDEPGQPDAPVLRDEPSLVLSWRQDAATAAIGGSSRDSHLPFC